MQLEIDHDQAEQAVTIAEVQCLTNMKTITQRDLISNTISTTRLVVHIR